jgi:hypothetical protein
LLSGQARAPLVLTPASFHKIPTQLHFLPQRAGAGAKKGSVGNPRLVFDHTGAIPRFAGDIRHLRLSRSVQTSEQSDANGQ